MDAPDIPDQIRLRCTKIGSKLRVRIISSGYNHSANTQFPRNIRAEGREYLVPASDISFTENARHKFFYRVKKSNITIVESSCLGSVVLGDPATANISKIYGDEDDDKDCCVCLTNEKDVVFSPCGHYCTCVTCSMKLKKCPICRGNIQQIVKRDQLE